MENKLAANDTFVFFCSGNLCQVFVPSPSDTPWLGCWFRVLCALDVYRSPIDVMVLMRRKRIRNCRGT